MNFRTESDLDFDSTCLEYFIFGSSLLSTLSARQRADLTSTRGVVIQTRMQTKCAKDALLSVSTGYHMDRSRAINVHLCPIDHHGANSTDYLCPTDHKGHTVKNASSICRNLICLMPMCETSFCDKVATSTLPLSRLPSRHQGHPRFHLLLSRCSCREYALRYC